MDVVKLKTRYTKVQLGDCVSVPDDYFGRPFQKTLLELGLKDGRVYGRVVECIEDNHSFSVQWDLDQQITFDHKLSHTVQLENKETPLQQPLPTAPTPVTNLYQTPVDLGNVPSSSNSTLSSHAVIEEDCVKPSLKYNLYVNNSDGEVLVMKGTMYETNPGVMVHNVPLPKTHQKFLIDQVLLTDWEGYNEDLHCVGSFAVWDLSDVRLDEEPLQEIEDEDEHEKESEYEEKEKGKKISKKQVKARKCRKRLREMANESSENEEVESENDDQEEIEDEEWIEEKKQQGEGKKCRKKRKII